MIDWTDVLDIGLPEIDRQHRKLISLSNSLIQAMTIGKGKNVLSEFFEELKAYTVYHFHDEEKYMQDIGYPQFEQHRKAHGELIRQVDDFRTGLMAGEVTPDQALDFINGWIINHIMNMDSQIGIFAKNR
ncbi:bacteriohemerythrin [uncultured Pseudodesulfovibrio sp.]|uniref:bacteriohemerythrin n=1 Tax=uncultured Pseudodesulfovibrio sp. TaxID=2035858 RepID=UPI0029C6AE56|nr:bacteriohemerythrin [uncultured Pseudodesulfovibrio sp.]